MRFSGYRTVSDPRHLSGHCVIITIPATIAERCLGVHIRFRSCCLDWSYELMAMVPKKGTVIALELQSAGGKVSVRKESAMALSGFLVIVGAIGSLVIVLDFIRPLRSANPFAG